MKHVLRPPLRNAGIKSLKTCPDPGDGAVVVSPLFVDNSDKTTSPLIQMIGNIRDKVCVTAVRLAHYAILVVTEVGCLQPKSAFIFISMTAFHETLNGTVHQTICVQTRLQIVTIKFDIKSSQVLVLLPSQVSYGIASNCRYIVRISDIFQDTFVNMPILGLDRLFLPVGSCHVFYVFTLIAVRGPAGIIRLDTKAAGLHR